MEPVLITSLTLAHESLGPRLLLSDRDHHMAEGERTMRQVRKKQAHEGKAA